MLGWYMKAEPRIHGPHLVGQPSGHGGGHGLPLLPRPLLSCGREGMGQTLPSTVVGDYEVRVGKCEGELMGVGKEVCKIPADGL
jgi:hypothetical protein